MSGASDHINKTLEPLRLQAASKLGEVRKILAAINTVEEMNGLPKTSLSDLDINISVQESAAWTDSVSATISRPGLSANGIRPDEYLGKPPLEAAKEYIERARRAVHIDEIVEAITKGGAATVEKNWREKLLKALTRSTRDMVKAQDGTFGLKKFYTAQQLKGLKDSRRKPALSSRPRKKPVSKRKGKPALGQNKGEASNFDTIVVKWLRLLQAATKDGLTTAKLAEGLGYKSGRYIPFLRIKVSKRLTDSKMDPKAVYEGRKVGKEQRWFAGEKIEEAIKMMEG